MTWHADVNVYIRKLRAVNPVYEQDAEIVAGIKGIFPDRGDAVTASLFHFDVSLLLELMSIFLLQ